MPLGPILEHTPATPAGQPTFRGQGGAEGELAAGAWARQAPAGRPEGRFDQWGVPGLAGQDLQVRPGMGACVPHRTAPRPGARWRRTPTTHTPTHPLCPCTVGAVLSVLTVAQARSTSPGAAVASPPRLSPRRNTSQRPRGRPVWLAWLVCPPTGPTVQTAPNSSSPRRGVPQGLGGQLAVAGAAPPPPLAGLTAGPARGAAVPLVSRPLGATLPGRPAVAGGGGGSSPFRPSASARRGTQGVGAVCGARAHSAMAQPGGAVPVG